MTDATDVLFVLAGMASVDLTRLEFCVITGTQRGEDDEIAGLAAGSYWPFDRGEVLVVGLDGREPFGEQRKPAKWDVDTEYVPTLAEALTIRGRVLGSAV